MNKLLLLSILFITECTPQEEVTTAVITPNLDDCRALIKNEQMADAFDLIQDLIPEMDNPMMILQDKELHLLIHDPTLRPAMRKILKQSAKTAHVDMAPPGEGGEPIAIRGKLLDYTSGEGIADVVLEFVHTDTAGKYFDEDSKFNPRIFCYVKTNERGEFSFTTFLPGGYPDDHDNWTPPHIHFTIEHEGFRPYYSEFQFSDISPELKDENIEELPLAYRVESSDRSYDLQLYLQPEE